MYKIIMHNQMSLNGAISGFQIDAGTYYKIVNDFKPEMYLIGSNAALSGIRLFSKGASEETQKDFEKPLPVPNDQRPYWVIPDSEGKLENQLHVFRNYEHCRDVIVLATDETPATYLRYLKERNYTTIVAGEIKVDFQKAFEKLHKSHPFETLLTDSGGMLSSTLFNKGLIDQLSLIISPVLTDKKNPRLFTELKLGKRLISFEPKEVKVLENNEIWMLLDVIR
jgi:2,5-diamino-6-(ribosylamino)-4(3H)-pyrimidinone 5'-phosphate reductase